MSEMRLIVLTSGCWAALCALALATDPPSLAGQARPDKSVQNVAADAKGETVRSARSLLGAVVKTHAGDEFGKITDLYLDFDGARVTGVVVKPPDSSQVKSKVETVSIVALLWRTVDGGIELDPLAQTESRTVEEDSSEQTNHTARLSATGEIQVTNSDGEKAGRIVDFGVAPSKEMITYAVPEEAKTWILELPEDILKNTPTFKKSPWPKRVPLAWTEYVDVRYGQPPDGGVQRKPHDKK